MVEAMQQQVQRKVDPKPDQVIRGFGMFLKIRASIKHKRHQNHRKNMYTLVPVRQLKQSSLCLD